MSAESGISTFRDSGGLWENYNVMDVASHDGYCRNPKLIHDFYNARRAELFRAQPNAGHRAIAELEKDYDVMVITQNVDNLHERAGSSNVLHLHGELDKVRAVDDESRVYTLTEDSCMTSPNFEPATKIAARADIFVIIGTSLAVYPAASLLHYVRPGVPVYYIDPHPAQVPAGVSVIAQGASRGMQTLLGILHRK